MLTIGICDDEANMRKALRLPLEKKLQLLGEEYRILEYDSGEGLLSRPDLDGLDLLFLDIEMKGLNGMDTAKALRRRESETVLIFVTAHPDYVFLGYEIHAFHYILKPCEERKIMDVLEQALTELKRHGEQFFTIEQKSGVRRIPLKKISAFVSDRRKITVITDSGEPDFYGRLSEMEASLPDYFIRIHNRCLVNLNYVTALEKDNCLCAGRSLPVSRTYRQRLEIAFAKALLQ